MITEFAGKTAVITGAGSGFGLACARLAAERGMKLVLVDVQKDALDTVCAELQAMGAAVMARRVDVAHGGQMQVLADDVFAQWGAPHLVFNNAGVAAGGLVWENTETDWDWVLGVNLKGVVHGVRWLQGQHCPPEERSPITCARKCPGVDGPAALGSGVAGRA